MACSGAMAALMAMGYPIRGGIEVGRGGEIYKNEIYGPVLNSAYFLENKKAQSPRILIGKELIKYLLFMRNMKEDYFLDFKNLNKNPALNFPDYLTFGFELKQKNYQGFHKFIALIKKDAELCLKLISKDTDDLFILDYFCKHISSFFPNNEYETVFKDALTFAKSEKEKFFNSDDQEDQKLYNRYTQLCYYLESRTPFWTCTKDIN